MNGRDISFRTAGRDIRSLISCGVGEGGRARGRMGGIAIRSRLRFLAGTSIMYGPIKRNRDQMTALEGRQCHV